MSAALSATLQKAISSATIGGALSVALIAESVWPLRPTVEPKLRRVMRNLATGAVSLALLSLLQMPLLVIASQWSEQAGFGLLRMTAWPRWAEMVIALLLLDYTLWIWHRASHGVPFLWRFHLVHHVDLDLDASTALRFHFGELAISIVYRMLQIALIGVDLYAVWIWQTALFAAILFHHANLRLPLWLERRLVWFIVTPRMHGIHHSAVRKETDSNWSSILTCWDFLHRTARLDVPQSAISIGVPAYRDPGEVSIGKILLLPFGPQRDSWKPYHRSDVSIADVNQQSDPTRAHSEARWRVFPD